MTMNSFSLRLAQQKHQKYEEEEICELLQLHVDGEAFPIYSKKSGTLVNYEPLDFSKLKEDWEDQSGNRLAPRFQGKFTVLIANHTKAFRTQTVDLSLAGLLLKDHLPKEFLSHTFDIVLIQSHRSAKKTFCSFRGRAVGRGPTSKRIQFESMTSEALSKFRRLLDNLSERKKKT